MTGRAVSAIVWAQWRSLVNHHRRAGRRSSPIALLFVILWYGFWALGAWAVVVAVANPAHLEALNTALPAGLLAMFLYWQIVPVMMVSSGVSLDLPRLVAYPIPHVQLFAIEVVLRVTTCAEMLLISAGLIGGIVLNPKLSTLGALGILVFAVFNLFVAAGLKDLLARLMERKGVRELVVFAIVLMAALPQILMTSGAQSYSKPVIDAAVGQISPWGLCARFVLGSYVALPGAGLLIWAGIAWLWGRAQFERTLRFDAASARGTRHSSGKARGWLDSLLRRGSQVFGDPTAALVEKEIRFLGRSPRFRLLFLMGFSFGLLVWLPMITAHEENSFLRENYLTLVSTYALMLLGEVCFWNNLGLDRAAAQAYFTFPIPLAVVLRSKNIAALVFIALELFLVAAFCAAIQMPVSLASTLEAFCVTGVFAIFLLSAGNLFSVRYPRPVDPARSWKGGSVGRTQAYLLLLYPLTAAPLALAYGAEFAFDSQAAFFAVLLLDFVIAVVVYSIALESAVRTAEANREQIVMALSRGEGLAGS